MTYILQIKWYAVFKKVPTIIFFLLRRLVAQCALIFAFKTITYEIENKQRHPYGIDRITESFIAIAGN